MGTYWFMRDREVRHLPAKERLDAARFAQERALRNWRVWLAAIFLAGSVAGLSWIDRVFRLSDPNGTAGAAIGFVIGIMVLSRTIYHCGLPFLRKRALEASQQREE